MISCIDLFCGVGGLTHGLEKSGIVVKAGFDIDSFCKFAFESNNRAEFCNQDVATLEGSDMKALWEKGATTLLAGCAPCQPFSTYSQASRKSKADTKWELVRHFCRLVKESDPDLVTMENVSQIVNHDVFEELLESLVGYSVWHSIVKCGDYGVPQTRKRFVLMASKLGTIQISRPKRSRSKVTVADAISGLPVLSAGEQDRNDPMHFASNLSSINLERIRASRPGGTWRDWPVSLRSQCHLRESGGTFPSVYGRMEWNKPAPTITTQCFGYGNGRFGHPDQDRAISLREAAMLQTFPRSYKFVSRQDRIAFHSMGKLIGNAVPVQLGYAIGKSFIDHVNSYA
jgi:DNA (cytosine-5)-methyltransferase 1